MGDLRGLSRGATKGDWRTENVNQTGADIYAGNGSLFVGNFRSNDPLPAHLHQIMQYDADFVCALVNAYREGRLVEKEADKDGEPSE